MKKGRNKILLLTGLVVLLGLAFLLFGGMNSEKKVSPEAAKAAKPEAKLNLAQETERKAFSKKLGELREVIDKFNQQDMDEFKNQTREGLLLLADLINELPELPEGLSDDVVEETLQLKKNAEKIVLVEKEKEIIELIKKSFDKAKDAVEEIRGNLRCEEEANKKFCENFEKRIDKIENVIGQINKQTYKQKTRELFFEFHSLLNYLNKEMRQPEFLTMMRYAYDEQKMQQTEQEVNKKEMGS